MALSEEQAYINALEELLCEIHGNLLGKLDEEQTRYLREKIEYVLPPRIQRWIR